jgi:hypothetical protein
VRPKFRPETELPVGLRRFFMIPGAAAYGRSACSPFALIWGTLMLVGERRHATDTTWPGAGNGEAVGHARGGGTARPARQYRRGRGYHVENTIMSALARAGLVPSANGALEAVLRLLTDSGEASV